MSVIGRWGVSGAVIAALVASVLGLSAPYAGATDSAVLPVGPSTEVSLPSNAFFGPFRFPGSHAFGLLSAVACPPVGPCVAVGGYATGEASGEDAMVVTQADEGWTQATDIPPPSPSHPAFTDSQLTAVACPATGECVALGTYLDGSGSRQTMAVSESNGIWGPAIEIAGASLRSLACRAPGSCIAIGTGSPGTQLVGVIQSSGVWGSPQAIALPANNAPEYVVELSETACQTSGPCVTVGSYTTTSHHQRGLGLVESKGRWTASEIVASAGSAADTRLYSVACPPVGPCVADGLGEQALGVTELDGKWGIPTPIMPAPNPASKLLSLYGTACAGSGQCFATGYDEPSSTQSLPVVASASGGVWGQAKELAPPSTAGPSASAQLRSVACTASDSCVAIGEYDDVSGSHAMAVSETHGVWGPASEISPPPGNANRSSGPHAGLALAACPGTGVCAALGRYGDTAGDMRLMAAGLAPWPLGPSEPSECRPASSFAIHVRRNGRSLVQVSCSGGDASSGSVELTMRTRSSKKRHPRIRVLASARFSAAAGTTVVIGLRLGVSGRRLLKRAHGRLSATLTVVRTRPAPTQIHSRGVRLIRVR